MKQIYLKSLELKNFRAQNTKVEFGDKTKIEGVNGCGKSTIMKAWMWLLSSYSSANETKNNNLFSNLEEINENTPAAIVTAEISVDGIDYVISKSAKAKFVRKRGTDIYEKASSDTYTAYIDNIEVSMTDYNKWIENNICPSDMVQYLLDGNFMVNLIDSDKNKARKVLENIIGEIKDSDMKGDYSVLVDDMKKFHVDAIEERTKTELKPIKARMNEIPTIIESKKTTLAEYEETDFDGLMSQITAKRKEIDDIDKTIMGNGDAIKPILGKRDEIFKIINDMSVSMMDRRNAYNKKQSETINAVKSELEDVLRYNREVSAKNFANKSNLTRLENEKESRMRELESLNKKRESLLKERDEIKARVFDGDKCAYCGQELPEEMLNNAKKKFNATKKADLDRIVMLGKQNNVLIDGVKARIAEIDKEKELYSEVFESKDSHALEARYNEAKSSYVSFEETQECIAMVEEIEKVKATLPDIPNNDNEVLTARKKMLLEDLESLNRKYGLKDRCDIIRGEIDTLEKERRLLANDIAFLEGKIDKCKEYRQERADIISFRINGRLTDCVIDMWSVQKDGTVVPDVVLKGKNGVMDSTINFSQMIKTCIELQMLFMNHYSVKMPIFVDEAAVFDSKNLPSYDGYQTIYLYASDIPYLYVNIESK